MTSADTWLIALVVIAGAMVNDCAAEAQEWTDQEVLIGRLAVNEASFREADTVAIAQARGRYSVEELLRMHPRALAPVRTDARRWIAGLDADAHSPDGWPESLVSWADVGRVRWLRTLAVVRATLRGERGCPGGAASIWGGRMDREHIERRLEQGFVIVDCGASANTFMRRGR